MRVAIHEAVDKSDGVVFRCTLSGSAADRWLEVPAWMFDRAACPHPPRLTASPFVLRIASKTLRLAAEAGEIEAIHPLPDGPWIFARAALTTSAARLIAERALQNPRYPAGSHPDQQSLFPSTT
jgi:hypothetical protein